jgi:hypothetical protein
LNCDTFSNSLFAIFLSQFWPAFWWRDSNLYFSLCLFLDQTPY